MPGMLYDFFVKTDEFKGFKNENFEFPVDI